MLITSTETIRIKLSSSVAARQMDVFVSYNTISTSGLIPAKGATSTNNTTSVDIVPAPSSGQQNQMRYCSIYNEDTASNTVTVEINGGSGSRTIFTSTLLVGDYIQYTFSNGWRVYNHNGLLKTSGLAQVPSAVRGIPHFNAIGTGTTQILTSGTNYAIYLGKADRAYTQISVMYNVTTALSATISWAELAIYKGYPSIGANTITVSRCGFKNCNFSTAQSGFNATGVKNSAVDVTDIYPGDDLWAVFGSVTTGTNLALTAGVADNIGAGVFRTVTGSLRPSTNSTLTLTASTSVNMIWIAWQGFQYSTT